MNFPDKLKEIRKNKGLSQEQLAEKIGVSRQAITKWETGKGLPDIENMAILAEIFKTTIDELVSETAALTARSNVRTSETIYDIDCKKHFDIDVGSANSLLITSGGDEKLHVRLKSETVENLSEVFKIKLDERKNRLDVNCTERGELSRFEAGEALDVEVILPEKYADHCEVDGSVKELNIVSLSIRRLEYDGRADQVFIKNSSGSLEFTSKTDYEITADKITGLLSVYQFHAKTLLHIAQSECPSVRNTGRKCRVIFMKNGEKTEFQPPETPDAVSVEGIRSELIIDLK